MQRCLIYDSYDNDEWNQDDSMQLEWDSSMPGQWSEAYRSFCTTVWSYRDGPLSDRAYRVLLEHFGLTERVTAFPKNMVRWMSPDELRQEARRFLTTRGDNV